MESQVNYAKVGLFVVIFTIILIVGGIWLSVGVHTTSHETYLVFMNESVSGLTVRAPVKYNGVDVGYVKDISLRKSHPDQVKLSLDIKSSVLISIDTRAVLDSQGLTGIAYLELTGGTVDSAPLKAKPGQKYPVIPSSPSLLFRLDAALDDLTSNLNNISDGLSSILNQENAATIRDTLKNIDAVSKTLSNNTSNINGIMANANTTMKNAAIASKKLPQVMSSIEDSSKSVKVLTKKLADAGKQADLTLRDARIGVQTLNNQLLPQAVNTLGDFQSVMSNLKSVSAQLKQNPSVLVRGKAPEKPGPGEK